MKKVSFGKVIVAILMSFIVCFGFPRLASADEVPMRTTINNESPLLLSAVYGNTEDSLWWGNTLQGAWNAIPDDLKPYAAIELHPAKVCKPTSCIPKDSDALRAWYKNMLDEAQTHDIPVFLVIMSAGERDTVSTEWLEEQFQKYDVLKGVMNIENYWIYNDDTASHSADYLNVCAKYGAHFIWHDHENWFWQRVMNNEKFRTAAKAHSKNLVLATKNTPIRDDASTDSAVNGLWLSGYCDNWGSSADTWKWWEKHYTDVFEPAGARKRDMRSYCSEPESMLGMEMMNVYMNGGTVYNFECAAYTFMDHDKPTPAFTDGIVPMFRRAVEHPAPSREEVRNRTKVVFWEKDGDISSVPNFYTDLYSDDETMPLYDTGRYGVVPVISAHVSQEDIAHLFPNAEVLTKKSSQMGSRVDYFNSRYPSLYQGDLFAQRVGSSWYAYNSNVNVDKSQTASLPLYSSHAGTLDLTLGSHAYAIVDEGDSIVDITLDNYRVDKSSLWAAEGNFDASQSWKDGELQLSDWLANNYCEHPDDDELRESVVTLHTSSAAAKPVVTVEGDANRMQKTEEWDPARGTLTLRVKHNGMVKIHVSSLPEVAIPQPEEAPYDASLVNVAYGKHATQSSTDYNGSADRAVDGTRNGSFGLGSVTHTGVNGNAWWEVDLGSPYAVDEIDIFNRTDAEPGRLKNYKVELFDAMGNVVWSATDSEMPNPSKSFDVGGKTGVKVRVTLNTPNVPLSLAEVVVKAKV